MDGKNQRCKKKEFFPKIEDRLKFGRNVIPNFTAIVIGHGNIRTYLHKYNTIDDPTCP